MGFVYLSVRSNALLVDGHRDYDAGVGHNLTQGLALGCVKEADHCASEYTQLQSGPAWSHRCNVHKYRTSACIYT